MMNSLALLVVTETLADAELPVAVRALPSKGDDVSAPLMPNATTAQLVLESLLKVIVIVVVPAVAFVAYQVST
jgi:hypothetical protein